MRSEVVYCQKFDNNRFVVGLKVRENRIPWSILRRFDGVDIANFDDIGIIGCKSCGSDQQEKFMAQIAIHLPGGDKLSVCVFSELLVCQHCGKAEFPISEDRLRLLMK